MKLVHTPASSCTWCGTMQPQKCDTRWHINAACSQCALQQSEQLCCRSPTYIYLHIYLYLLILHEPRKSKMPTVALQLVLLHLISPVSNPFYIASLYCTRTLLYKGPSTYRLGVPVSSSVCMLKCAWELLGERLHIPRLPAPFYAKTGRCGFCILIDTR